MIVLLTDLVIVFYHLLSLYFLSLAKLMTFQKESLIVYIIEKQDEKKLTLFSFIISDIYCLSVNILVSRHHLL